MFLVGKVCGSFLVGHDGVGIHVLVMRRIGLCEGLVSLVWKTG